MVVLICFVFGPLASASEMAMVKINDHKPPTGDVLIYPNQTVIISVTIASDREGYRVNRAGLDESFFDIISEQSEVGTYRIELRAREDKRGTTEVVLDILDAAGDRKEQKTVSFNILDPQEMDPRIISPLDKELDKRVTFEVETGISDSEMDARKVKIAWIIEGDKNNEKDYYGTFSGNDRSRTLENGLYHGQVIITDALGYMYKGELIFGVETVKGERRRSSATAMKTHVGDYDSETIDFGDTPNNVTWHTPFILDLSNSKINTYSVVHVHIMESDQTVTTKILKSSDGVDWLSPSIAFQTTGDKRYLDVEVYDSSGKYLQVKKSFNVTVKPTYYNSSQEGMEAKNLSEGFEKFLEEESQSDASQENIFERMYHEGVRLIKDLVELFKKI